MSQTTTPANNNGLETILQELVETPYHSHPTTPKCTCHIINPKVHRLILWKEIAKETGQEQYTLRIGSQRFISVDITDKNGQVYWRFNSAGEYSDGKQTIN